MLLPRRSPPTLPSDTAIGAVHLRVARLGPVVEFYSDVLGLNVLAEDEATAALAAHEGPPLIVLHAASDQLRPEEGSPGLFHLALRVASRDQLGGLVHRLHGFDVPIQGYADHNVSESVYLADPEGNGIELYADRSPEVWRTVDGEIFITTEALDLEGLLAARQTPAGQFPGGSCVGHIHLQVSSLSASEAFYCNRLGLGLVTRRIRGALFLAAGSYHHHLGLNDWQVRPGVSRRPSGLGIVAFELIVSDGEVRRRLTDGADEGLLMDPDGIGVRVVPPR